MGLKGRRSSQVGSGRASAGETFRPARNDRAQDSTLAAHNHGCRYKEGKGLKNDEPGELFLPA